MPGGKGTVRYQRKDAYYTRAKAAGYRSRAAYKLLELARRHRLIAPGDHVVDLGAWPGGWLQVAAELAGPHGVVVGVDLVPIARIAGGTVSTIQGDIRDGAVQEEIRRRCAQRVDVVLSDMAPKLTGVRARDEVQGAQLAEAALDVASHCLRPGGRLLVKVFTGPSTETLVTKLRRRFQSVKLTGSKATRRGSAEQYVVAIGFCPAESFSSST